MKYVNRLAELRAVARVRVGAAFRQEDLAKRLGVSRQTLAAWEQGMTEPTVTQALALAREFGVGVEDLGYASQPSDEADVDDTEETDG